MRNVRIGDGMLAATRPMYEVMDKSGMDVTIDGERPWELSSAAHEFEAEDMDVNPAPTVR
jgi:hypothetical protein